MFRRLTNVRLKAAEQAFAAGQLERALDVAAAAELADNRRAADLLAQLFTALMTRSQDHLLSGRFRDALLDLDRAARCRVHPDKVEDWRRRALAALRQHQQVQRDQQQALAAVQDGLAAGALTEAGQHLARLPDQLPHKEPLMERVAELAARASRLAADAHAAAQAGQAALAVQKLEAARAAHAACPEAAAVADGLLSTLINSAREALAAGRVDAATRELDLAERLDANRPDVAEVRRALNWVRSASQAIHAARFDDAAQLLAKFVQVCGQARWARDARDHLQAVRTHLAALAESPLALAADDAGFVTLDPRRQPQPQPPPAETLPAPAMGAPRPPGALAPAVPPIVDSNGLARRLLLLIDGVGTYLLLRSDRITLGRPGPSADLPFQADLSERHAEIYRAGDDYFLVASSGVELAGAPVQQALLNPGDRIQLGRRVRFVFERPSPKSPAAVLKLGDGVNTFPGVRSVVLWAGPVLIGPTRECHIPLRGQSAGAVLLDRGSRFEIRPMPGAAAAGLRPLALAIGQTAEFGSLRLTLQPARDVAGSGMKVG